ncbi:MAG: methylated-DNA--[protein]-cysteine S-methyltransferase [Treponema sp.]|nr:methylated-DNA--[protein]-cysteine S-methyltransferase [Treponema sp.]
MIYTCTIDTPLGKMTASGEEGALTGLWFVGQKHYPQVAVWQTAAWQTTGWQDTPDYPLFEALRTWLKEYFAGGNPRENGSELPLLLRGTAFQEVVWELLRGIRRGETATYGGIAKQAAEKQGRPVSSPRAVGSAVARNPISILIPCHRVVGASGELTGYAGGLERKRALLDLESSARG